MSHDDQAATLRAWASQRHGALEPRAIAPGLSRSGRMVAIGGGKGGIGKTVLTANLACMLGRAGKRTLAVDADLGLSNLDLAMGVTPRHTLLDVIEGAVRLDEAMVPVARNVSLLGGTLGRIELTSLAPHARLSLTDALLQLDPSFELMLLDMPSGVGEQVMHFALAAAHVIVVATPEPTALADAYAFVKVLRSRCGIKEASFVANMVRSQAEGEQLYDRLAQLCDRFLGVDLGFLGALCLSSQVAQSVRTAQPFVLGAPQGPLTLPMESMAYRLLRVLRPQENRSPQMLGHKRTQSDLTLLEHNA